jgi:hypothetical protein
VLDGPDVYQGPVEVNQDGYKFAMDMDLKFWNSNGHSPDTKIHATKHGMASPFSNYHCISHPYASNKQCLMVQISIKALWKSFSIQE